MFWLSVRSYPAETAAACASRAALAFALLLRATLAPSVGGAPMLSKAFLSKAFFTSTTGKHTDIAG